MGHCNDGREAVADWAPEFPNEHNPHFPQLHQDGDRQIE